MMPNAKLMQKAGAVWRVAVDGTVMQH